MDSWTKAFCIYFIVLAIACAGLVLLAWHDAEASEKWGWSESEWELNQRVLVSIQGCESLPKNAPNKHVGYCAVFEPAWKKCVVKNVANPWFHNTEEQEGERLLWTLKCVKRAVPGL